MDDPEQPPSPRRPSARARAVLRVGDADRRAFEWVARRQSRALDWTMPRLTHMGDNGSLWAWTAVLLALLGGRRGRRAARAGLLTLALASPVVNGPFKWVVRRPRPVIDVVPEARRIRRTPRTTSFPSGHSASAWCFSVAASLEAPILAPVLVPMAAAVAYSRVYTGAHYPGDAVAGSLLGAGFACWLGPDLSALGARLDRLGAQLTEVWVREVEGREADARRVSRSPLRDARRRSSLGWIERTRMARCSLTRGSSKLGHDTRSSRQSTRRRVI